MTTLGVGGAARFYLKIERQEEVPRAIAWARTRDLPWMVLGGGSNVIIADEGFEGLVVHLALRAIEVDQRGDDVYLIAAAGEAWDPLVKTCVDNGWAGVECLSGVPGLVGATPIQNVGAYGQEVGETITSVSAYDSRDDKVCTYEADECGFAYRNSRFKSQDAGRHVVLAVSYRLRAGGPPMVRYSDLQRALEECGITSPGLRDVRNTVIAVRRRKSMVFDPADPSSRSVGSFFLNPVVPLEKYQRIVEYARRDGLAGETETPPHYPAPNGVKLSAAWLVERAGFHRGCSRGRVGLSKNHALAIVNHGNAMAAEVVALAREIREGVLARFGVTLMTEPVFVGMAPP